MSNPVQVDLRALVANPIPSNLLSPVLVQCPCHDDPGASLGVYHDHLYCHGKCQRYFRRYESVALLLGWWNGNPETAKQAVAKVYSRLDSLPLAQRVEAVKKPPKPIDNALADTFHRYLLSSPETLAYFMAWRGLKEETIAEFNLGYTGTHFTIPVFGSAGGGRQELCNIRYRQDPRVLPDGEGSKYSGLQGRNERALYSVRRMVDIERAGSCWIFEGEFDSQIGWQLGLPSVTITNGAGVLGELPQLIREIGLNPATWIIAVDQDEAGEKAAWELQQQLGSAAVRARWDESYKDISAFNAAGGRRQDIMLDRLTEQQRAWYT